MNFEAALSVVLHHEGGYVNHPDDLGGPTKYGITLQTLKDHREGAPVSAEDVQELTETEAADIYHKQWLTLWLDTVLSPAVAVVLFDQAVLDGTHTAVARVQRLLGVPPEGKMGPLTVAAINRENGYQLAFKFVRASVHHYTEIVARHPAQSKFLNGWIDRLMSLLDFVFLGDFT